MTSNDSGENLLLVIFSSSSSLAFEFCDQRQKRHAVIAVVYRADLSGRRLATSLNSTCGNFPLGDWS